MKTGHKAAAIGCLAVAVGSAVYRRWMIRMSLREFTRCALYMAVMDDEICRNELEGNQIGDAVITFPPKAESLQAGAAAPGVPAVHRPAERAAGSGVLRGT